MNWFLSVDEEYIGLMSSFPFKQILSHQLNLPSHSVISEFTPGKYTQDSKLYHL